MRARLKLQLALLALLPSLLAWSAWALRGPQLAGFYLGSPQDEDIISGFHGLEQTELGSYRWSSEQADIRLPASLLPGVVELRGLPAPGVAVRLGLDDQPVELPPMPAAGAQVRRYRLYWPGQSDGHGLSTLAISATTQLDETQPRAERRSLGLLLSQVTIKRMPALRAPPLLALLLLGLLPLLVTLLLWAFGAPSWPGLGLALMAGAAAIGLWAWRPLWVQPWLLPATLMLGALCLFALALRGLQRRLAGEPVLALLAALALAGGMIPLYSLQYFGLDQWWHSLPLLALLGALLLLWPGHRPRALGLTISLGALLLYLLPNYAQVFAVDYADDFWALFRGARSFLQGGELYSMQDLHFNHFGNTYKYPPFFAMVVGPLTGMLFAEAIHVWQAINLGLLLLAALLLWRWARRPLRSWSTLALVIMLGSFQPLVDTLRYGQVDLLIFVALAGALLALRQARWGWWGALLALPAAIKLYPAYLVLHSLALRRPRGALGFALGFIALTLLAIAVLGWPVHQLYLREVLPLTGGGTAWVENQTINGFLNRITSGPIALRPEQPGPITWLTYAAALVVSALTWLRARRMRLAEGFGLWIVAMLLVLPAAWNHYQVILLIPFYQLFVRIERQGRPLPWPQLALYALAWMLLCAGNQWTFFDRSVHGPVWALILSYKFYGMVCLWFALALDPSAREDAHDDMAEPAEAVKRAEASADGATALAAR